MRHSQGQANPIMLGLLAIPLLMALGAVKGCDMVRETLEPIHVEQAAPPAVRSTPPVLKGVRV